MGRPPFRFVASVCLLLAMSACNDDSTEPSPIERVQQLSIVSGDAQVDTVGQEVPDALVARAIDDQGQPIQGIVINFVVTEGDGSVFAGSNISNADGLVQERWTLGATAGAQAVEARAVDQATGEKITFATFTATALPDRVDSISVAPSEDVVAAGDTVLISHQVQFFAEAFDQYGNLHSDTGFVWNVSDTVKASIDDEGLLLARDTGAVSVSAEKEGVSGQYSIVIIALPPEPVILAPSDSAVFEVGESIAFVGEAEDPDGGGVGFVWRSTIDGILGSGAVLVRDDLSIGNHTIWLIATDDEAQTDSASVAISVIATPGTSFALRFDGAQSTETPDAADLDLTNTFTIELWIKPSNVTGTLQHLVSKWGSGSDAAYHVAITNEFGMDRKFQFGTRDAPNGSNTFAFSSTSLENDVWQHVVAVFDNGEGRIYINGQLDATQSGMHVPQNTAQTVSLARERSGIPKYFSGLIDEVRIWNVARSAQEIADNMNVKLTGSEPGLVAYWQLDEGSGDTATDATGNAHDMRLGDEVGADSADPAWVSPGRL